jgi:hypothetical protein
MIEVCIVESVRERLVSDGVVMLFLQNDVGHDIKVLFSAPR